MILAGVVLLILAGSTSSIPLIALCGTAGLACLSAAALRDAH